MNIPSNIEGAMERMERMERLQQESWVYREGEFMVEISENTIQLTTPSGRVDFPVGAFPDLEKLQTFLDALTMMRDDMVKTTIRATEEQSETREFQESLPKWIQFIRFYLNLVFKVITFKFIEDARQVTQWQKGIAIFEEIQMALSLPKISLVLSASASTSEQNAAMQILDRCSDVILDAIESLEVRVYMTHHLYRENFSPTEAA